jgi:hypothetical protein
LLRLRTGTATLLIGPRSSAVVYGSRYCLDSETDIRQRLMQSLRDPASREAIRRFWGHWQIRFASGRGQGSVDRRPHRAHGRAGAADRIPSGGTEVQFPYPIPPEFISVVK